MNGESGNEQSEAPKKISAEWAMELDTELKCDRKGKEMCDFGKCWKEVDLDTGEITHHPVNPRDSSFWLLTLVRKLGSCASID